MAGDLPRLQGKTFPAQLKYKMIADMACERITAGITREMMGEHPIKAVLDPYNPIGSTMQGKFNTSKNGRWDFAEFTEAYQIESDFKAKVESEFNRMIETATAKQGLLH